MILKSLTLVLSVIATQRKITEDKCLEETGGPGVRRAGVVIYCIIGCFFSIKIVSCEKLALAQCAHCLKEVRTFIVGP